jgi:hypothetical protein
LTETSRLTLRAARLVADDGTHASGKTTLSYAVAALLLRRHGVHVGVLGEPARLSPFVDDVVIHKAGDFDMLLELDLFALQITQCVRGARSYDVVLADKIVINVLTYCKLVVPITPGTWDAQMVGAMDARSVTQIDVVDTTTLIVKPGDGVLSTPPPAPTQKPPPTAERSSRRTRCLWFSPAPSPVFRRCVCPRCWR